MIKACEDDANSSSKYRSDVIETHQSEDKEVNEKKERRIKGTELLERIIEDNEKMMVQLFERNEMQTKLLSSLSNKVE